MGKVHKSAVHRKRYANGQYVYSTLKIMYFHPGWCGSVD